MHFVYLFYPYFDFINTIYSIAFVNIYPSSDQDLKRIKGLKEGNLILKSLSSCILFFQKLCHLY